MQCVVLELNNGKVWVARTRNPEQYVKYIEDGSQPKWVKKHGYKSVLETTDDDSMDVTHKYMRSHGIDNVRGFHYATDKLVQDRMDKIKEAVEKLSEREKAIEEHRCSNNSKDSSSNVLQCVSSDGVSDDEDSDISTESIVNYLLEQIEGRVQETLNTYQSSNSGEDNELSQKDNNVPEEKNPSLSSKIPNYIQVMDRVLRGMLDDCDKNTR